MAGCSPCASVPWAPKDASALNRPVKGCSCSAPPAHAAALLWVEEGQRRSPRRQKRSEGLMGRCFTLTCAARQALAAETSMC